MRTEPLAMEQSIILSLISQKRLHKKLAQNISWQDHSSVIVAEELHVPSSPMRAQIVQRALRELVLPGLFKPFTGTLVSFILASKPYYAEEHNK